MISPEEYLESLNINRNFMVRDNQWKKPMRVADLMRDYKFICNRPTTEEMIENTKNPRKDK